MSFQDVGASQRHYDRYNRVSPVKSRPFVFEDEPPRILPRSKRGVRPRLETACPVTTNKLFHIDDASTAGDTHTTCHSTFNESTEEDPMIPPVTPSPMSARTQSIYSQLTSEIVNYQKMVAELESLLEDSGQSPEKQWRTRILIRSAQDADRDIWKRLYEYESEFGENPNYSRAQIASRKLHRDFRRVHKHLQRVLEDYEQRQLVEVSFLTTQEEKKEDFFDRAMREREEEVNKIHSSMKKVNEIYEDLANLVDGQQEQIDKLAENTDEARANTRSGLEQIQQSVLGLCGPVDVTSPPRKETRPDGVRVSEEFKWSMPFETISDDMRAVQQDVIKFGRNLMEDLQENVQTIENPISGCGPAAFGCQPGEKPARRRSTAGTTATLRSHEMASASSIISGRPHRPYSSHHQRI